MTGDKQKKKKVINSYKSWLSLPCLMRDLYHNQGCTNYLHPADLLICQSDNPKMGGFGG